METYTIINIPEGLKYYNEIKNEITHYLDKFNITFPEDSEYRDLHKTYISLFDDEISDLINECGVHTLSFRIIGATRGSIFIKEISRDVKIIEDTETITILYEIKNIEFIDDTCFKCLKAYKPEVVDANNNKFRGKKLIINITR